MSKKFIPIAIKHIHARAKSRPPGYVEDMLAHGTVKDGYLILDETTHQMLVHKYNPTSVHHDKDCPHCNGQRANFIPDIADDRKKASAQEMKDFRIRFLGPLENVPPHLLHLRMALEQAKADLTSSGCTGCQRGAVIREYTARAWEAQKRAVKETQ